MTSPAAAAAYPVETPVLEIDKNVNVGYIRTPVKFNNTQKYNWLACVGKDDDVSVFELSFSKGGKSDYKQIADLTPPCQKKNSLAMAFSLDDNYFAVGSFGDKENLNIYYTGAHSAGSCWTLFKTFDVGNNVWEVAYTRWPSSSSSSSSSSSTQVEQRVITGSYNPSIEVWDPLNQKEQSPPLLRCKAPHTLCYFGATAGFCEKANEAFLLGGDSGQSSLALFDSSGKHVKDLVENEQQNCPRFSHSMEWIASANSQVTISIFSFDSANPKDTKLKTQLKLGGGHETELCFSRYDEHLLVASGSIFIFDALSGKFDLLWKLEGTFKGIGVSANDSYFATIDTKNNNVAKIYPTIVERRAQVRIRTVFRIQHFGKGRMGKLFESEFLPGRMVCKFLNPAFVVLSAAEKK